MVSARGAGVSRRSLLIATAGAGSAGAAALAGCTAKPTASNVPLPRHTPTASQDVLLLTGLLELERYAVAAYAAGVPLLRGDAAEAAEQFLTHEISHVGELIGLIRQAGSKPPRPPAFYDLGHPRGERQVLELLHRVERSQLAGYLSALPRLAPARLRAAVAAILANDAQHAAVVRQQLGLAPVPTALLGTAE